MSDGRVRIGMVGLGAVSTAYHLPALSNLKHVEMVAASDVDASKRRTGERWGIKRFYTDYAEMLEREELDGVFILTPTYLHHEMVLKALEEGVDVFCEKPMGTCSDTAYEAVRLARRRGLALFVGYDKVFEENFQKARRLIEGLRLGRLLQVHGMMLNPGPFGWAPSSGWYFNEQGGGVLYDLGSHLIHLIHFLTGERISWLSAHCSSSFESSGYMDNLICSFRTGEGVIGTVNIGWNVNPGYFNVQLHGTAGSLLVDNYEMVEVHPGRDPLDMCLGHLGSVKSILARQMGRVGVKRGFLGVPESYFKEDREFIELLKGSREKPFGEDALRVLEVLDAIKSSLSSHRPGKVRYRRIT